MKRALARHSFLHPAGHIQKHEIQTCCTHPQKLQREIASVYASVYAILPGPAVAISNRRLSPASVMASILSMVYSCHGLLRYPTFRQLFSRERTGQRFAHMLYITYSNAYNSEEKAAMIGVKLQPESTGRAAVFFGGHAVLSFQQ